MVWLIAAGFLAVVSLGVMLQANRRSRTSAAVVCVAMYGILAAFWWNSGSEQRELDRAARWADSPAGIAEIQRMEAEASARQAADQAADPGIDISVPSDSRARYRVIELWRRPDGLVSVSTRRVGPSGVSYEERLIDCPRGVFAYVRSGDTREEFDAASQFEPLFGPFTSESISSYVGGYACRNAAPIAPLKQKNEPTAQTPREARAAKGGLQPEDLEPAPALAEAPVDPSRLDLIDARHTGANYWIVLVERSLDGASKTEEWYVNCRDTELRVQRIDGAPLPGYVEGEVPPYRRWRFAEEAIGVEVCARPQPE